jgi:hypothetical protein
MRRSSMFCAAVFAISCGPQLDGGELDSHEEDEVGVIAEELNVASPVPGHGITTPFGKPGNLWAAGYHTGDDYAAPIGSAVVSTRDGRVVHSGFGGFGSAYGRHVIIDSGGIRHLYAHLSATTVSAGEQVNRGERIGSVGVTGNTTGPHCHYEERVSPYGYFNHRRPVFNKTATGGTTTGGGYKNWTLGNEHSDITGLQRALVSAGCDVAGKYTDFYGANTRSAVTCFQRKQGWTGADADGLVGPTTAARLFLTGTVDVSQLRYGVQNSASVKRLQQRLNEVRHTSLAISGDYNDATRSTARAWQLAIGDSGSGADGNIGPLQAEKLFPDSRYSEQ